MPKMVIVRWRDTESMGGWKGKLVAQSFAKELCDVVESIGFLYKKNKRQVVIYQSLHHYENGTNYGEMLKIPMSTVVSVRELGVGKKI
jgi:hypothetical protein